MRGIHGPAVDQPDLPVALHFVSTQCCGFNVSERDFGVAWTVEHAQKWWDWPVYAYGRGPGRRQKTTPSLEGRRTYGAVRAWNAVG